MPRRVTLPRPGDLVAGTSVALLVIPQAVGLAVLAGLPPEQGVYAAALAPLATAFTSSSPYLQAGPTAMTSLLTLGALTAVAVPFQPRYVALAALLALVVGAIRIAMGLLRIGPISYLMSRPVVAGFTAAAGVLIVLSQLPAVLGVSADATAPVGGALDALARPGTWDATAIALAAVTLALILGGRRLHPLFPGVLIAAAAGIAIGALTSAGGPEVGDVRSGFPPLSLDLPWGSVGALLLPGLVIAVIGFAEPAAIARHYATTERRAWDPNREFVSQGLANVVAAVGRGYPVGGSFSRSALNKLAGAETRWSSVVVAVVVLAFLPFLGVISPLPRAVLAATVVAAAISLLDVRPFRTYLRIARVQFWVATITFVATIAAAPHVERGVVLGVVLAVAAHLWRELRITTPTWVEDGALHLRPRGVLYYASAPMLQDAVGRLVAAHPDVTRVVIHLDGLGRVDLTGALALRELLSDATRAGLAVEVVDVPPQAEKVVARTLADDVTVTTVGEDATGLVGGRREGRRRRTPRHGPGAPPPTG